MEETIDFLKRADAEIGEILVLAILAPAEIIVTKRIEAVVDLVAI